ncbi:MAG: hypothetical protein EBU82_15635, partial [Flavobacteriia bacterium]|nr:hypothetical protein [Flavobacteriia bacterium]
MDINTAGYNTLTTSSGVLLVNGAGISGGSGGAGVSQIVAGSNISISPLGGTGVVTVTATGGLTTNNLISTVEGLGTVGYVSTLSLTSSLVSTTEGITIGIVDLLNNLGSYYGYISSPQLISTVEGLGSAGYLSTGGSGVFSTVYINQTAQTAPAWNSNTYILGNDPQPSPLNLDVFGSARILKNLYVGSTTTVIGTRGVATPFVSTTAVAASSFNLLDPFTGVPGFLTISSGTLLVNNTPVTGGGGGTLTSPNLVSSLDGLGTLGYVSSLSLRSTIAGLGTAGFVSTSQLNSTVAGLGTYGFVSTLSLRSTVAGLGQTFASTTAMNAFFSTFSTTISRSFNS